MTQTVREKLKHIAKRNANVHFTRKEMTMEGNIRRFALIVDNIEKTMENFWNKFGVGPFKVVTCTPENTTGMTVHGEVMNEFEFVYAIAQQETVAYEIIQPVKGDTVYAEYLEKYGPGLYSIKAIIPEAESLNAYVAELEEKGLKVMQSYKMGDEMVYTFDSMNELAAVWEFSNGGVLPEGTTYPEEPCECPVSHKQNIKQLAVVVKDVYPYMDAYAKYFGEDGWDVRHFTPERAETLYIKGEPYTEDFDFICSVRWFKDMEMEIIQPIKGEVYYYDFLNAHGPGFHHIKDVCPDEEILKEKARMEPEGLFFPQNGGIDMDTHYYWNSDLLVHMCIEFGNGGPIQPAEEVYYTK